MGFQVGNTSNAPASDLKIDHYEKITDINVKGTILCVRAVSKAMATQEPLTYEGRHGSRSLGRGSIINLGSANSYIAAPGMMSYTTSKHAVIGITKSAGKPARRILALWPCAKPQQPSTT